MCTIYFSKRDYREDMRSPNSAARSHAICRRLLGVPAAWNRPVDYPQKPAHPRQAATLSAWYGAHYWAACAATSVKESAEEALEWYARSFAIEISGGDGPDPYVLKDPYRALWALAVRRVWAIRDEALALASSVLW